MRAEFVELDQRVRRALVMENTGPRWRRIWWIVTTATVPAFTRAA